MPAARPDDPHGNRIRQDAEIERHVLTDDGTFPNTTARRPLLLLRGALRPDGADDPAALVEAVFARWAWTNSWRNGIYGFHHYHSTSHEALGCYAGQASVRLGGPTGRGITATVRAGDVLVIPAGVAHCNLGSSPDFAVVGAYPDGRRWDLLRGGAGERPAADARIAALPLPEFDPVLGPHGPLRQFWT